MAKICTWIRKGIKVNPMSPNMIKIHSRLSINDSRRMFKPPRMYVTIIIHLRDLFMKYEKIRDPKQPRPKNSTRI